MIHRNIIRSGRPLVLFRFQFIHICGTSWMHHKTVPIVPKMLAAKGIPSCGAILEKTKCKRGWQGVERSVEKHLIAKRVRSSKGKIWKVGKSLRYHVEIEQICTIFEQFKLLLSTENTKSLRLFREVSINATRSNDTEKNGAQWKLKEIISSLGPPGAHQISNETPASLYTSFPNCIKRQWMCIRG